MSSGLSCGRGEGQEKIGEFSTKITKIQCSVQHYLKATAPRYAANGISARNKDNGAYIGELDDTKATKFGKAIVSSIFVHNQGDILHRFRTEPTSHGERGFAGLDRSYRRGIMRERRKTESSHPAQRLDQSVVYFFHRNCGIFTSSYVRADISQSSCNGGDSTAVFYRFLLAGLQMFTRTSGLAVDSG